MKEIWQNVKCHAWVKALSLNINYPLKYGLPRRLSGKESIYECRRRRFDTCVAKIPWRRKWQATSVFLPGKIPWTEDPGRLQSMGSQESDMPQQLNCNNSNLYTKRLFLAQELSCQPLQLSNRNLIDSLYNNASEAPIGSQWWSLEL